MNTSKFVHVARSVVGITIIIALVGSLVINVSTVFAQTPFTNCLDVTEIPQAECEALVALYNSTNGTNWVTNTDWLVTDTPCSWYGVRCDEGYVTQLHLGDNQLSGNIPVELGNLTQLRELGIRDNQLSGSIPTEFGDLTQLQQLQLDANLLSGSIPMELGNLTQLTELTISRNQLTGNIPAELGNLTLLINLWLHSNQLTGSIPSELGNLAKLRSLELGDNGLTGSIPAELGNLTELQSLGLVSNELTGDIPAELGNLTKLQILYLYDNQLSGSIPTELGNLTQLVWLNLQDNQLSGSIPRELGNLIQLTELGLNDNQLTGSIPAELGNLTHLAWLALYSNQLSGSIPTEFGNLVQLMELHLNNNQLAGSIPVEFGNLTQLTILRVENNLLSGEFPVSITNLVNLTTLRFDCELTSSDPVVIAFLKEKSDNHCFPDPFIIVRPEDDGVFVWDWPLGALLMLEIDDPATPQIPDYTASQVVGSGGWENGFNLNGIFDIQPGHLVTVSDGYTNKQHTVTQLAVINIDIDADTISGTGYPGSEIHVGAICDDTGCASRNVLVDENGNWLVDFSVPVSDGGDTGMVFDLRPGSGSGAYEIDDDADATNISWNVTNPIIRVDVDNDRVLGMDWPLGATVNFEIDDPLTQNNPDYTHAITVEVSDWDPNTWFVFYTNNYDLKPGDIVTATDGNTTKQLIVSNFKITAVDVDTDTVYGIADPGQGVRVWTYDQNDTSISRLETTDQDGNWSANFAVPGDEDSEQGTIDIRNGSYFDSFVSDEDWDATGFMWWVPNPTFNVRANYDQIEALQWDMGDTLTLEVDNPSTADNPDYTITQTVTGPAPWDSSQTYVLFELSGVYDIQIGDLVSIGNGSITKTTIVTNLAITGIHLDTDIVEGIAETNQTVNVWTCWQNTCVNRDETADQNGHWVTNFAIPGEQDWEQDTLDVQPGSWIDSSVGDEDGDSTMFGRIAGSAISGTIYAIEIAPDNTVAGVMIEACTTDNNFCRTTLTDSSGNYAISGLPAGTYNLKAIPPGLNLPGYLGPVDILYDETLSGQDIIVPAPPLPPPPNAVEPAHTGGGTISVYWGDSLTFTAYGCVNGTATFELTVLDDGYTINGEMTETPVGFGTYKATISPLFPHHGVAEIVYTIICPDGSTVETPFFIYIDPSGVIKNTSGAPIQNVTVTLFYADNPDGPFTEVPDGSTMMSPSNRDNPDTTNANGQFGWDVVAGFYKVRAEKAGCFSPTDPAQAFVESAVLTIPPLVTGLELILKCQQPPSASAGGPYSLKEGFPVMLNASGSTDPDNNIASYEWDLDGDGQYNDAIGVSPRAIFPDNGVYIVRVLVTDDGGLSDVAEATVTVKNAPPVILFVTVPNFVRAGSVINVRAKFKDPGTLDTFTAIWKWGDGTTSIGRVNGYTVEGSHTYRKPGIYFVTIIVKDEDGGVGGYHVWITVLARR